MKKNNVPIIYLWMYKKILDRDSNLLSVKEVSEILRRSVLHQVPRPLHFKILKEMERYELIEKINDKAGYRILGNKEYRKVLEPFLT